jgi:hypothetical protein
MSSNIAVEAGDVNHPSDESGGEEEHEYESSGGEDAAEANFPQQLIAAVGEPCLQLWWECVPKSRGLMVEAFQFRECGASVELFFDFVNGDLMVGIGFGFEAFFAEPVEGGGGDVQELMCVFDVENGLQDSQAFFVIESGVKIECGVGVGELMTELPEFFAGLLSPQCLVGGMCLFSQFGGNVNAPCVAGKFGVQLSDDGEIFFGDGCVEFFADEF